MRVTVLKPDGRVVVLSVSTDDSHRPPSPLLLQDDEHTLYVMVREPDQRNPSPAALDKFLQYEPVELRDRIGRRYVVYLQVEP